MKLVDSFVRNVKSTDKLQKFADGGSLFLHVQPNGTKRFVMAYRFQGKQRSFALGVYPAVSLKQARKHQDSAKELLAQGVNPNGYKQAEKALVTGADQFSFLVVSERWFQFYKEGKANITAKRSWSLLDKYVLPKIGEMDIREVSRKDLVALLDPIVEKGYRETAEKVGRVVSAVFDDAMNRGIVEYSIAQKLSSVVPPHPVVHRAAILGAEDFGRFLVDIDQVEGLTSSVKFCLMMMPYVFVRHSELRCAKWDEFNLEQAEWLIPAERMKMKHPHFVPLSKQVLALLSELQAVSSHKELLFPSLASRSKPISDSAMRVALRRIGYAKEEVSIHGFRSTASTMLHEMGYRSDIIERQLAHKDTNTIRAAYNHAEFKGERVQMMQAWADYIDSLKALHAR